MTTSHDGTTPTDQDQKPDIDQLQSDIERTRGDLAETVDALTAKLDVKTRAKQRVADTRRQAAGRLDAARVRTRELTAEAKNGATDAQGKPTPAVLAGTGIVVAALVAVGVLLWSRGRR